MAKNWTTSSLAKLFKIKDASKAPIIYAEEKGEIPKAERSYRGNIKVRQWQSHQLPLIGARFPFLKIIVARLRKQKAKHVARQKQFACTSRMRMSKMIKRHGSPTRSRISRVLAIKFHILLPKLPEYLLWLVSLF